MREDAEKNLSAIICYDTCTKRNAVCRECLERHKTSLRWPMRWEHTEQEQVRKKP